MQRGNIAEYVRDGILGRLIIVHNTWFDNPLTNPTGTGDISAEIILWLMAQTTGGPGGDPKFQRGDSNADGTVNIADAIFVLTFLFGGGNPPVCVDTADANDDGVTNIADAIATLSHLFGGAGPLADPFGACGVDPTDDTLDCLAYPPCD